MAPRTPLLAPDEYFRRRDAFSIARAGAVVALNWLALAAFLYAFARVLLANIANPPPELRDAFRQVFPGVLFGIVFALLLAWLLTAVGLYALSRWTNGDGSFERTLAVAGWGFAPDLIVMPIRFALLYLAIDGENLSAADPRILAEQTSALIGGADGPFGVVLAVGIAIWSAYVWTYGLARVHDVDRRTAAIPAGIVASVGFLLSV